MARNFLIDVGDAAKAVTAEAPAARRGQPFRPADLGPAVEGIPGGGHG